MSKTYEEIKAQFSALKQTSEYVQNRMVIISMLINDVSCKSVIF